MPWSRIGTCCQAANQRTHHRIHQKFGYPDRYSDENLPDLSRGRAARSLAGIGPPAQRLVLQRLPQPHGEILSARVDGEGVDQRYLCTVSPGYPPAIQSPLAHAAARRADELPVHGDAAAGAKKATVCFACHGANGVSVAPTFPRLAGQRADYLYHRLVFFKRGDPKGACYSV